MVLHWKHPFTDAHNVTTTRLVTMQLVLDHKFMHVPELFKKKIYTNNQLGNLLSQELGNMLNSGRGSLSLA